MPRPRILLAMFIAVGLLSFAQTPTAVDDPGVTVNAGASLRHRSPVHYPQGSIIAGTVEIEASLNASGEVADAHVVSGPEELRKEALSSVLQWHYDPGASVPVHVSIRFDSSVVRRAQVQAQSKSVQPPLEDFLSGMLKAVEFAGLNRDAENEIRSRLPLHEGDPVHYSDFAKITNIVREYDEHLSADVTGQIAAPDAHRDLTIHIHAVAPAPTVLFSQDAAPKPRPVAAK